MMLRRVMGLGAAIVTTTLHAAPPELPALFSDHAVLQRDVECRVWGTADPLATITVELGPHTTLVTTGNDGRWIATLPPTPAGGPHTLTVTAAGTHGDAIPESITRTDLLFGDVWLASGQSNMEWPLERTTPGNEFINAAGDSGLRVCTVPNQTAATPQLEANSTGWAPASPDTVRTFSAVAYHFGVTLRETVKHEGKPVPIGLIDATWGGTRAEAWTPAEAIEAAGYTAIRGRDTGQGSADVRSSGSLYNAMIHPLTPMPIAGVIWYQGESNASRAEQYHTLFPVLIESWRTEFAQPEMPFYFVQLANFKARSEQPQESEWAELREAQTMTLSLPHTGMACIIDLGEANDIHPRNKHDVGRRLARLAQRDVYGLDVIAEGPVFSRIAGRSTRNTLDREIGGVTRRVLEQEITLEFEHASGLSTTDGQPPRGFEVAEGDQPFVTANARIEGDRVILTVQDLASIDHIRYAWADNPNVNLVNSAGLPAVPFRTDSRPGLTAGRE